VVEGLVGGSHGGIVAQALWKGQDGGLLVAHRQANQTAMMEAWVIICSRAERLSPGLWERGDLAFGL
jgi:hypothetical protein